MIHTSMRAWVCLPFVSSLLCTMAIAQQPTIASYEEAWTIDSELANYDGKQCVLTGNVQVEHELGMLTANQAIMLPADGHDKTKAGILQVLGDVVFNLKEGGRLECAKTEIDCQSLCGVFFADRSNESYVVYTDIPNNSEGQMKPLVVKGRQMKMTVNRQKQNQSTDSPKGSIDEIIVDRDVVINYIDRFVATGGHAVYKRNQPQMLVSAPMLTGMITLQGSELESLCAVKTLRGDLIKAKQITLDTNTKKISFNHPSGCFVTSDLNQRPLHFAAETSTWDEPSSTLMLKGNVHVSQGDLGNLDAEEVHIFQQELEGQKSFSSVETKGKAVLSYSNEDKNLDHCLTCYGFIKVDHVKKEVWLFSPKNGEGKVVADNQIHFDDIKGEIFADKAFIKYELVGKEAVPTKIVLGGNVRLLNTLSRHENGSTTALQYALADQVEYIPHSSEMLFKSHTGRRVLFFDKTNNLQVSAPTLKIIRGTGVRKETIQGYGDVRFSFIEHEFEQLRKRFAFDKSNSPLPIKR